MEERQRKLDEATKEAYERKKYQSSVWGLFADGPYVFAYVAHDDETQKRAYDVFDTGTGAYLSTVTFPARPHAIRNGFFYISEKDMAGFTVVRKYRIDPTVYHKR